MQPRNGICCILFLILEDWCQIFSIMLLHRFSPSPTRSPVICFCSKIMCNWRKLLQIQYTSCELLRWHRSILLIHPERRVGTYPNSSNKQITYGFTWNCKKFLCGTCCYFNSLAICTRLGFQRDPAHIAFIWKTQVSVWNESNIFFHATLEQFKTATITAHHFGFVFEVNSVKENTWLSWHLVSFAAFFLDVAQCNIAWHPN